MARKIYTLESVNDRLRSAHVGVEVLQRGRKLSLRATLPPKPGSGKNKPTQQTIATGKYANPADLRRLRQWQWNYGHSFNESSLTGRDGGLRSDGQLCGDLIEQYKIHCLKHIIQKPGEEGERIWQRRFLLYLRHLPPDAVLTEELLSHVAQQQSTPNSRNRQLYCQEFKRFARFAGVDVDFGAIVGKYSSKSAKRDIPDDEDIERAIDEIKNESWQWIAGMMATYGLRDHECWLCQLEWRDSVLVVLVEDQAKTGYREVFPFHPRWVERWNLERVRRPNISPKWLKDYGDRCSKAFKREQVGFTPYTLRHAWCIRVSVRYRVPLSVAAAFAGHSPQVRLNTYNRWISAAQYQQVYQQSISQFTSFISPVHSTLPSC